MTRLLHVIAEQSRSSFTPGLRQHKPGRLLWVGLWLTLFGFSEYALSDSLAEGKALVMEKSKGNCLTCHVIADGKLAGNVGPPLLGMKARFPDAEVLYSQIWDATARNPDSRMPPFGRHGILSNEQIDLIIEYLYTL